MDWHRFVFVVLLLVANALFVCTAHAPFEAPTDTREWDPLTVGQTIASSLARSQIDVMRSDLDLRRWLASLKFRLPDETNEKLGVTLSNMRCSNLDIARILSSEQPDMSTSISLEEIDINCSIHANVRWPHIELDVEVLVSKSKIILQMGLDADKGDPPLPISVGVSHCEGTFTLHVSSSSKLFQAARPFIEEALHLGLGTIICKELKTVIATKGDSAIRSVNSKLRTWLSVDPISPPRPSDFGAEQDLADLSTNPGMRMMASLSGKVFGNFSSPANLNGIARMLMGPAATLSLKAFGRKPWTLSSPVQGWGLVNITLQAFRLSGLDSWTRFAVNNRSVREPSSAKRHQASIDVALGEVAAGGTVKLIAVPQGHSVGPLQGDALEENFDINVTLRNLGFASVTYLGLNKTHFESLAIDQFASMGCLVAGIPAVEVGDSGLRVGEVQLDVKPLGSEKLAADVDDMLRVVINPMLERFAKGISLLSNHAVAVSGRDGLNAQINKTFGSAGSCRAPAPTYAYEDTATFFWFSAVLCTLASIAVGFSSDAVGRWCKVSFALPSSSAGPLSNPSGIMVAPSPVEPGEAALPTTAANTSFSGEDCNTPGGSETHTRIVVTDSLAFHPRIPSFLRLSVPLLTIASIFMFLAANLTIGASVQTYVTVNGNSVVNLPPLFKFSLVSTVKDMWNAELFSLAIIIAFFSGAWPYVKLLTMLFAWFSPSRYLSVAMRQRLLNFFDAYGKYSLVDSIFMIIFSVAFSFRISVDALPPQIAYAIRQAGSEPQVQAFVEASWGFYSFLVASMLSVVLGIVMSACHRYALKIGEYGEEISNTGRSRLCNVLRPSSYWAGKLFVYVPLASVFFSIGLVLVGSWMQTFRFDFYGLVDLVLAPGDSTRQFSVWDLAWSIPSGTRYPDSIGSRSLQAVFIIFIGLVVYAYQAMLICLWCAPLTSWQHRQFLVAVQVLNAFSCLDVFVLAIVASIFQMHRFVVFIVGTKCDKIDAIVDTTALAHTIRGGYPVTCFDLATSLLPGFWILLTSTVLSMVVGHFMVGRCSQALCAAQDARSLDLER